MNTSMSPDASSTPVDPPSGGALAIGISTTATIITLVFVGMRAAQKIYLRIRLFADDYFCFLSWALVVVYVGMILSMVKRAPMNFYVKQSAIVNFIYAPAAWCGRAAIFLTYIRLFGTKKWLRWASYFGMIVLIPVHLILPVVETYCILRNDRKYDIKLVSSCSIGEVPAIIQGVFGLVADIYLLILPLPVTFSISLPLKKRVALSAMFLTAFLGIISSVFGIVYRVKVWDGSKFSWNTFNLYICLIVEMYATIIVSCAPATRSFWLKVLPDMPGYQRLSQFLEPLNRAFRPLKRILTSVTGSLSAKSANKGTTSLPTTSTKWRRTRSRTRDSSTASRARLQEESNRDDYEFSCIGMGNTKQIVEVHAAANQFSEGRETPSHQGIVKTVTVNQF